MAIEKKTAVVWFSPSANRRFFSKKSAVDAETRSIIRSRYPTENAEYENGMKYYPGFYWEDLPRSAVLYRRLRKIVENSIKESNDDITL